MDFFWLVVSSSASAENHSSSRKWLCCPMVYGTLLVLGLRVHFLHYENGKGCPRDTWTMDLRHLNSIQLPMYLGLAVCFLSILVGLIMIIVDRQADDRINVLKENAAEVVGSRPSTADQEKPTKRFNIKDIKNFDFRFWILVVMCFTVNTPYYSYINIASKHLQNFFGIGVDEAGKALTITFLCAGFLVPATGYVVDKIGKRAIVQLIALVLLFCPVRFQRYLPFSTL
eukprot:TRINITY_DN13358_c0_g1_i1.p1 TRINITY_DN13358_c0_g1~~TRINITY_DN13358_c0_g1_i1.p1  ORF type:complete len:228 (+),score=17.60 TRINITY_DN13358_c0_g1_i1:146-829(+)